MALWGGRWGLCWGGRWGDAEVVSNSSRVPKPRSSDTSRGALAATASTLYNIKRGSRRGMKSICECAESNISASGSGSRMSVDHLLEIQQATAVCEFDGLWLAVAI